MPGGRGMLKLRFDWYISATFGYNNDLFKNIL